MQKYFAATKSAREAFDEPQTEALKQGRLVCLPCLQHFSSCSSLDTGWQAEHSFNESFKAFVFRLRSAHWRLPRLAAEEVETVPVPPLRTRSCRRRLPHRPPFKCRRNWPSRQTKRRSPRMFHREKANTSTHGRKARASWH